MTATPAVEARFWSADDTRLHCYLCPHNCSLAEGKTGRCGVRRNQDGVLTLPYFGAVSSMGLDPIEKKPLYHFFPGSMILSAGFLGCNLICPFCQNFAISQSTDRRTQSVSPNELVSKARETGSFAIAYTYNEPTVHIEYVMQSARLARKAGLMNVLVTNGNLNPDPAAELLELIDAVNVDLKSFNPDFYRRELGGDLEAVQRFIRMAGEQCHLEITTLLIPGKNDTESELSALSEFVASVDPETPLHLSAYYPTYRYTVPATTGDQINRALAIATRQLRFVYPGNLSGESNTSCPECGHLLVRRLAYRVSTPGLEGNRCTSCGANIRIVNS